jgi:hypothetical protein
MKKNNGTKVITIEAKDLQGLMAAIFDAVTASNMPIQVGGVSVELALMNIAAKKGWKVERVNRWLYEIATVSPIAAFNIVARELAVELDKKYEDHIEKSDKIFVISPYDGVIHEVCKKYIKNYRNFPAFRSVEDAKVVCTLLRGQLKGMFSNARKQKD